MINSIRKRLVLIYTGSTGLILTAVLIFVLMMTNQQLVQSKKDTFLNNFVTVTKNVQMNNVIRQLWIAEMEKKNRLIVHIEDNGKSLQYKGAWQTPTEREVLINKVKQLAKEDNIDTNIRPMSLFEIQSNTYELNGNKNDQYLGAVFIVPMDTGYRSVVMLQSISHDTKTVLRQLLFVIFAELAGITALFFVSRRFVGKTLKPVEESRRRQTEFVAAASHELKSPLAVIRANASALVIEPDKLIHYTKGIDKECERLSGLIGDMLLLASADAKSWRMKNEIVDMDTLLIETYELFYPLYKEKGKELKLNVQEEMLPKVEGDSERLKQILAILLDNAASYSKDKDVVIFCAYRKKKYLYIEVEDHGGGIEESKKEEVFQRFYREDKARKDKNHYGLGLSVAKELVEMQNGSIFIKDTTGGGATFIICFPLKKI